MNCFLLIVSVCISPLQLDFFGPTWRMKEWAKDSLEEKFYKFSKAAMGLENMNFEKIAANKKLENADNELNILAPIKAQAVIKKI